MGIMAIIFLIMTRNGNNHPRASFRRKLVSRAFGCSKVLPNAENRPFGASGAFPNAKWLRFVIAHAIICFEGGEWRKEAENECGSRIF